MFNNTWITKYYRMRWYITINIAIRCDKYIISDCDIANYC